MLFPSIHFWLTAPGRDEARPWRACACKRPLLFQNWLQGALRRWLDARLASSLRVCPCTPSSQDIKVCAVSGCARAGAGSRAARHRIRRDDSRMDTAEVEIPTTSCSSSWPRTPGFHFGNAGSNPAHDATNKVLALTIRESRNRPQRLGGTGTRHRNLFIFPFASLTQWSECRPV